MIFHLRSVRAKHLLRQFMLFNSTDQANIHKKVLGNSSGKANTEMERTIAIGQMCATNDKLANRQQVQLIVESAVEQRACVSFFGFGKFRLKKCSIKIRILIGINFIVCSLSFYLSAVIMLERIKMKRSLWLSH